MYLEFRGGVKSACSKGFECLKVFLFTPICFLSELLSVNREQASKENQVNCCANAHNDRACHYEERSDEVIQKPHWIATKIRDFLAMTKNCSMFAKAIAFTLAETLIVMGVIGVVAALTLPNLNSSTGDKEKIAKLKKIYSNLNDAYGRMEAIYGPACSWLPAGSDSKARNKIMGERMSDFLKISKNCGFSQGCATDTPDLKLGQSTTIYKMILADGSSLAYNIYNSPTCSGDEIIGNLFVDIDGPNKGANSYGKDIFLFRANSEGVYPAGGMNDKSNGATDELLKQNCFVQHQYCTGWAIENGNMDYLKVDSNGKCNNSSIILNWTTNSTCK